MKKIKVSEKRILSVLLSLSIILTMSLGDVLVVFAEGTMAEQAKARNNPGVVAGAEASDKAEGEQATEEALGRATELEGKQAELTDDQAELTDEQAELADDQTQLLDYTAETPTVKLIKKIKGVWLKMKVQMIDDNGEATLVDQIANLREIAGLSPTGFNVMQGGCCDGERYAYFSFMAKATGKVKIVKFEIIPNADYPEYTEFKYISSSDVLGNISHGNDLAYFKNPLGDGKDKILIITNDDDGLTTNYVSVFDVESMSVQGGRKIQYWKDLSECNEDAYAPDYEGSEERRTMKSLVKDKHGFSSIAYDAETDRVVAVLKGDHDLGVFRPVWCEDGTVDFKIQRYIRQNKNDQTLQGLDCDANFIYTSWSGVNGKNVLQVYDWNGNKIGNRDVTAAYEIENIFHTGSGSDACYYGGFHYSYWFTYYTEELCKVKWKKVWKKVKWKKVNGKWKYKKKRVWKYKTELKQVEHSEIHRDAYCMRLGNLI